MFIRDFINRDIKYENESKRVIVTLRILYIVIFCAFLLDILYVGVDIMTVYPYRISLLFAALLILFIYTYFSRTTPSIILFMLFTFVWTLSMIPCFGWSAGMQNYFILILMLCFFALHLRTSIKFLYAGFVLIFRIITIGIFGGIKPALDISSTCDKLLQITNITAVFLSIIIISYIFSKTENEAESKLMKYNDRLLKAANSDQLTGLPNRRGVMQYLNGLKDLSDYHCVSVAMGDIDFFKKVNDTYGHDAGDEVLKSIAEILRLKCNNGSIASRWGGEEFLLVFPDINGDDAYMLLEQVRMAVQKSEIKVKENKINVTMTFGLAEWGFKSDLDDVIKEADDKLYHGKENGRNQVVY
ncbi:MAG: GGDEF domain-containing protein [Eubacterium sp.]|nr:GGDEF domain-containing protein [Eubacterium sp.]